jgi:hypothetical protein
MTVTAGARESSSSESVLCRKHRGGTLTYNVALVKALGSAVRCLEQRLHSEKDAHARGASQKWASQGAEQELLTVPALLTLT